MLDLANEVAKLQGRLVLSTFRQKSHSLLVLNTEHNGVVHCRVASTCSCKHARACLPLIEAARFAESSCKLAQFYIYIFLFFKKIWIFACARKKHYSCSTYTGI